MDLSVLTLILLVVPPMLMSKLQQPKNKLFRPVKVQPKNVLVIGASTGYGLASRITAAFGYQASTLGIFFEKPPTDRKTASAGYYNSAAFEHAAHADGLYAKSING